MRLSEFDDNLLLALGQHQQKTEHSPHETIIWNVNFLYALGLWHFLSLHKHSTAESQKLKLQLKTKQNGKKNSLAEQLECAQREQNSSIHKQSGYQSSVNLLLL